MKFFILLSVMFLSANCSYSQSVSDQTAKIATDSNQTKLINEDEAVKIAENFIIENGYTDLPPTDNKTKIVFESIEGYSDLEELLKFRQNTLQKKAYGILKGRKNNPEGFMVIFLYTEGKNKETGRAVTMNTEGKNIRVEHADIFLKAAQKQL